MPSQERQKLTSPCGTRSSEIAGWRGGGGGVEEVSSFLQARNNVWEKIALNLGSGRKSKILRNSVLAEEGGQAAR